MSADDFLDTNIEDAESNSRINENHLPTRFYFNNIRFVHNVDIRESEQSHTFLSTEDFFSSLNNTEDIHFVRVILGEGIIWDEKTILDKLNNTGRPLLIEVGSSVSTKVYIKYTDKDEVMIIDLNSPVEEITKDDLLIKLKSKDHFVIPLLIEGLKQGLIGHFNDKLDNHKSMTDVTFECISLDYTMFHNDILSSCWLTLHIYNTLYDAIRSNNVNFLNTMKKTCKDYDFFKTFDNILPDTYDEILLKGIALTKEMKFLIEDRIINLSFFIDKMNENKRDVVNHLDNVHKRIKIVSDSVDTLKTKYAEDKIINGEFIYISKFVAQNIRILKHQLQTTYDRLPWEEIEFCLVCFIYSHFEYKEFNFLCKTVLDKKKIIFYLEKFTLELNNLKEKISEKDVNGRLPKEINKKQLENSFELYKDYYLIKNIYSLTRIEHYVTLALEINFDEDEELSKLLIERVLQVIGESFKNTTESPNVSDDVHDTLFHSAPRNVKDIATSLRDSLSHFHSLSKKTSFITNKKKDFFQKIQNDLQKIMKAISDPLYEKKVEVVTILLNKIIESENLLKIQELLEGIKEFEFKDIKMKDDEIKELEEIKKLVVILQNEIKDQTSKEKGLFDRIVHIISQQNEIRNDKINYLHGISLISTLKYITDLNMIKSSCRRYLMNSKMLKAPVNINEVAVYLMEINASVTSRGKKSNTINNTIYKIHSMIEFSAGRIRGIDEFKQALVKEEDDAENRVKESIKNVFDKIMKKLKETSDHDSVIFKEAWLEKEKSCQHKMDNLLKAKHELIPLFVDLEKLQISKGETLDESKYNELLKLASDKLDKIVNNKQLRDMFSQNNWKECKNIIEKSDIGRDSYHTLLNSVKNSMEKEYYMSKYFRDFVSSFKIKNTVIKSTHGIIDSIFKEHIHSFFDTKLEILQKLLSFFKNHESPLQKYVKDEKLQSAVEIVVLDLTEVLQVEGHFVDNLLALERCCPVLVGKTLRNYLAHGDALIDILPCDPSIAILSNALRFIKEGKDLYLKEKKLIGQMLNGNLLDLSLYYNQGLYLVTNQNDMFTAAKEGNLEEMKHHIDIGADISGRDYKGWSALHFAAQGNNVEILKYLLDKNLSLDFQDIDGQTTFHIAATFGSHDVINYLLENGADVNSASNNNWTPLHLAAKNGHIEVVKRLLQDKADINSKTKNSMTALKLAKQGDHIDIYEYLLQNGATIDISEFKESLNIVKGLTPLHIAAFDGNIIQVETLLANAKRHEKTILLEARDEEGKTPLHRAVFCDNDAIVKVLLKEGAKVNVTYGDGITSLHLASTLGYEDIVETLLEYGAEINSINTDHFTALDMAAMFGHEKVVDILFNKGASVVAQNEDGFSALHLAVRFCQGKVVETLLNGKIEINVTNNREETALHIAALHGYTNIIELLLNENANVNALDRIGFPPLHWAAFYGKKNIVDYLLLKGALFDLRNKYGLTALDLAKLNNHRDIVKRLLDEKVKVDSLKNNSGTLSQCSDSIEESIRKSFIFVITQNNEEGVKSLLNEGYKDIIIDENGKQPIHLAAFTGHTNIIKILLERKVDCNAIDYNNYTPLHYATRRDLLDNNSILANIVVKMLLDAGAKVAAEDCLKMTPLHYAAMCGYTDVVETLLTKVTDVNPRDKKNMTPLHYGTLYKDVSVAKLLLKKGADVNVKDINNMTPLHHGSIFNFEDLVELLLKYKVDIRIRDYNNMTPLDYASMAGFKKVESLLKKRSEIDARNRYLAAMRLIKALYIFCGKCSDFDVSYAKNSTSLHYAARYGYIDIVETLLMKVTDVNVRDEYYWTPLHYGVLFGHINVVERLLEKGAVGNAKDQNNRTPIHYAAMKGNTYMVQMLMEKGADLNSKDSNNMTPLHYGTIFGKEGVVQCLLNKGAVINVRNDGNMTPLDYASRAGHKNIEVLLKKT